MLSSEKFNSNKVQVERNIILQSIKNRLDICRSIIGDENSSYTNLLNEKILIFSNIEYDVSKKDLNTLDRKVNSESTNSTNSTNYTNSMTNNFKLLNHDLVYNGERERPSLLSSLNKNVVQINDMFKDLHSMIESQGENIDRIEQSVTKVNDDVVKSEELIKESEILQSKGIKVKIIAGFLILITTVSSFIGFKNS